MELFHIFSFIIFLSAIFAYLNHKYIKLPASLSLMLAGFILSVVIQLLGYYSENFLNQVKDSITSINFSEILLEFMLSFLLFAGSLHTNYSQLKESKRSIIAFSTIGVLISTFTVGYAFFYLSQLFNYDIQLIHCLLFGALISPTDPIAVLGILRKAKVPKSVEIKITGESLFNDGVGVVVFLVLFNIASKGPSEVSILEVGKLFASEVLGGISLGLLLGYLGYIAMKSIDHYQTEVMITLAIVMGGYTIAHYLHFSGPLGMVVAGLFIGNKGTAHAMSDQTLDYVNKFWEMLDEILNAFLFVLIGLELLIIKFDFGILSISLVIFLVMLSARYIALIIPSYLFNFRKTLEKNAITIMTWGGLRGGISLALALSLGQDLSRDIIVPLTYIVVFLSLILQGLTIGPLIKKLNKKVD